MGIAYEQQLDATARSAGAHYTPIDVAISLAQRVITDTEMRTAPTVWDPACGAGALLLAAAEVLLAAGHDPTVIVGDLLWGTDTDADAVAVTEAALVLWATLHGAPDARPGPHLEVADALATEPALFTVPTLFTEPPLSAGPALATEPGQSTEPALFTEPPLSTGPALATEPGQSTEPALFKEPPLSAGPALATEPARLTEPGLSTGPVVGGGHRYVIGNPPFQGQLTGSSVRGGAGRELLRRRWGDVVGPYTDTSTLFLVAGIHALAPGGRLGMILPTSVLAARDAAAARRHLDDLADLAGLWVATEAVFTAAVEVCAPVLVRRPTTDGPDHGETPTPATPRPVLPVLPVLRWRGRRFEALPSTVRDGRRWSELALAAHDVPLPAHRAAGRLGDVAVASSGFRDEYYGLVDHVHEELAAEARPVHVSSGPTSGASVCKPRSSDGGAQGSFDIEEVSSGPVPASPEGQVHGSSEPNAQDAPGDAVHGAALDDVSQWLPSHLRPLVTSGLIDPGRCHWGDRPVRFAKQVYSRPVVAFDALVADAATAGGPVARAAAWVAATSGPKVVVATQTRVGEATVDESGSWVPSTPTIVIRCSGAVTSPPGSSGSSGSSGSPVPVVPGATVVDRLWAIAAVICSPLGTVVALADTFGTARSVQAIKPSATSVLDLPLPVDPDAWSAGAAALRCHDRDAFVSAMADAYGITGAAAQELHAWWAARAPW